MSPTQAYRALISALADRADESPVALSHADLAVILKHNPQLFHDALAEGDNAGVITEHLHGQTTESVRLQCIGRRVVEAVREYVLSIVLADVQAELDERREQDERDRMGEDRYVATRYTTETEYGVAGQFQGSWK